MAKLRKHDNKYFLREKEYRNIVSELNQIYDNIFYIKNKSIEGILESRLDLIRSHLKYKFYPEYSGKYNHGPKWYRRQRNKIQRAKNKTSLFRVLSGYDEIFNDNYKDSSWYW